MTVDSGAATVEHLAAKVAEALTIADPKEVVIFSDREQKKILTGSKLSLSVLGLKSGDSVFIATKGSAVASVSAIVTDKAAHMSTQDIPHQDIAAAASAHDRDASSTPVSASDPAFSSFDGYLKTHAYNLTNLPLTLSFKPIRLERQRMLKIPPSVTLKHQPYRHVDHLEFMNVQEVMQFVNYWRYDLGMQQHRAGLLFGSYAEDRHYDLGIRAIVEAIYEPPQTYDDANGLRLLHDPHKQTVRELAGLLGLEPVGWIFTHGERAELLTSKEILEVADLQLEHMSASHYTGYPVSPFVTCTVAPCAVGDPVPNAFMVSDLGLAFRRDDAMSADPKDKKHMILRTADEHQLFPDVLEAGSKAEKFDADWLIVRVVESAPLEGRSVFKHTSFPREHRILKQDAAAVESYLRSLPASEDPKTKLMDFHLLVYAATHLSLQRAADLVADILDRKKVITNEAILSRLT